MRPEETNANGIYRSARWFHLFNDPHQTIYDWVLVKYQGFWAYDYNNNIWQWHSLQQFQQ